MQVHCKQASLPESLLAKNNIEKMKPGDVGYTMHWAMWVDSDMRCWLHPTYPFYSQPAGTASMLVMRGLDGTYEVKIQHGETYTPSTQPGYASPADTQYIPVAKVHGPHHGD